MRMAVGDKLRAWMRTAASPGIAPDVANARATPHTKQRIAALSGQLSHAVFLGLIAVACLPWPLSPSDRGTVQKALPSLAQKTSQAISTPTQTTTKMTIKPVAPAAIEAASVSALNRPSAVIGARFQRPPMPRPKGLARAAPAPKDLPLIVASMTDLPPPRLMMQSSSPIRTVAAIPVRKRDTAMLQRPPRSTLKVTEREIKIIVEAEPEKIVASPPAKPVPQIGVVKRAAASTVVNAWSSEQISEARAACARIITSTDIIATEAEPVKEGSCGAPAPVTVSQIGAPKVKIQPAAMLTCPIAAALDTWITGKVQPAALAAFGVPVARLISASSYSCRNRYGRTDM